MGQGGEHSLPNNAARVRGFPRCYVWVEFVVGSRPCFERFFSGYSGFLLFSKTNTSKFIFDCSEY